jgi:hypothetical protein
MDTEESEIKILDADELASIARQYYATRFPNPQRIGCPPPGKIIKVVSRRRVPDQALREHLFECSECFGEYRQALAQCRQAPVKITWWERLVQIVSSNLSATAIAAVILILSSLVLIDRLIWRRPALDAGNEPVAGSIPSNAKTVGAGEPSPSQTAIPLIAANEKPQIEGRAMDKALRSSSILKPRGAGAETIDVDLDNYLVFRRGAGGKSTAVNEESPGKEGAKPPGAPDEAPPEEKIISLPSTRASLVLRLPETAAPGKYNVSLINAFGRALLTNSAFSPDGAKLRVTLDLRRVPRKKYRLRLWRNGEAPAFYDVIVNAR